MAIKRAVKNDDAEIQQELAVESRDEKLLRAFNLTSNIYKLQDEEEKAKTVVSGYKAQIKELQINLKSLVDELTVGQETFIAMDSNLSDEDSSDDNDEGDQ